MTDDEKLDSKAHRETPKSPYRQPGIIFTAACSTSCQDNFFQIVDVVFDTVIKENVTSRESCLLLLSGTTECSSGVSLCTPRGSRRGAGEPEETPVWKASEQQAGAVSPVSSHLKSPVQINLMLEFYFHFIEDPN